MTISERSVHFVSCPACQTDRHERLPTPGRWIGPEVFEPQRELLGLARCSDCGLVFVNPRPGEDLLSKFYGGTTYECHRPDTDAAWQDDKATAILERVRKHVPHARRLLDYGCGGGFLLRAAREHGFEAVGLDVGSEARRACRAQGFVVAAEPRELEPGSFDAIVLHHVFEHMPDPRAALGCLSDLLTDRGVVFIEVPNVRSLRARLSLPWLSRKLGLDERHRAFPIHLWYFEPNTLSRLMAECGFEVTAIETHGLGVDELFYRPETASAEGSQRLPQRTRIARKLIAKPIREAIKRFVYGRALGENVLAVARARQPSRAESLRDELREAV